MIASIGPRRLRGLSHTGSEEEDHSSLVVKTEIRRGIIAE